MAEDSKRAAVYVSWVTFKNALEQLAKGMPSRIDRSVFTGIAWNVQSQLFAALKFLGLIQGEDEPTPILDDLVKGSEGERKAKLKKIIEERYADLIAIDLTKATRSHFEERMGELYNVNGDTRDRAVRFFLNAAAYVGIPLSPFILPKEGATNGSKRKSTAARSRVPTTKKPDPPQGPDDPVIPAGTSKSVSLKSGGTLTLSATLDFFALNSADRKFVFELIDKLDEYAQASARKAETTA